MDEHIQQEFVREIDGRNVVVFSDDSREISGGPHALMASQESEAALISRIHGETFKPPFRILECAAENRQFIIGVLEQFGGDDRPRAA